MKREKVADEQLLEMYDWYKFSRTPVLIFSIIFLTIFILALTIGIGVATGFIFTGTGDFLSKVNIDAKFGGLMTIIMFLAGVFVERHILGKRK